MPIKGLSDRRRFTRGGHLRLGKKHESGRYPVKSDHFIADFENPEVEALFYRLYGAEPKRITICFGADDAEDIFPQYYKCYGSSAGLKCKGDGEVASRINTQGELEEVDCPTPEHCEFGKRNGCKQMASMQFFIKGLPGIQIFQVNTTSFNSIVNLNSGIDLLRTVRGGRSIRGVWVDLCLNEQQAQANGKAVTIYVMKLDIPVSLDNLGALQCAFDAPALLPPDESRDEYLTPTLPAAEVVVPAIAPAHPADLKDRFAAACAASDVVAREYAQRIVAAAGVAAWADVPVETIEQAIAGMEAAAQMPPAPVLDEPPAPVTVTIQHPSWARLHQAAQAIGLNPSAVSGELMEEHGTWDAALVPTEAIEARAAELEARMAV